MATATRVERIKDIIGAVAFIFIGGVFWKELQELPPAVIMYPSIIIYFIIGLCIILLVRNSVGLIKGNNAPAAASSPSQDGMPVEEPVKFGFPTIFVLILSLIYVAAMPYIGFILASWLMMVVFMVVMNVRSIPVLVLVPVLEIAFLWYVFEKLLAVFLPGADWLRTVLGMG